MTARYTTADKVKLALRAPTGVAGAASWSDSTYDDVIADAIEYAESDIDAMCSGWSPFNGGTTTEERKFVADGASVYRQLSTDVFNALPTQLRVDDTVITHIKFRAAYETPGIALESYGAYSWVEGTEYQVTAEWGFPAVPANVVLAATRAAARVFLNMRNTMGILEVGDGVIYMPKTDPVVTRWLSKYGASLGMV